MKKQLRKPENWSDFENLCKVLWGEIWECSEIKKNGRSGQAQNGVDVYGTPKGETDYYGIQCKGKDDYTNSKLSKKEIDNEIEKAKKFQPTLKKFYFATTANKDAKIEEYVRLQDKSSRDCNGFEIHLFSWEDIVELIDENRRTHDWYVNNIGFTGNYSVEVTFANGETHLQFEPTLIKNTVSYFHKKEVDEMYSWPKPIGPIPYEASFEERQRGLLSPQPKIYDRDGHILTESTCLDNMSTSVFRVKVENNGTLPVKNLKLYLAVKSSTVSVEVVDKEEGIFDPSFNEYNTQLIEEPNYLVFTPKDKILVQKEKAFSDEICIRSTVEDSQEVTIDYQLVAADYDTAGQLKIRLDNVILEKESLEEIKTLRKNETRLDNCLVRAKDN